MAHRIANPRSFAVNISAGAVERCIIVLVTDVVMAIAGRHIEIVLAIIALAITESSGVLTDRYAICVR